MAALITGLAWLVALKRKVFFLQQNGKAFSRKSEWPRVLFTDVDFPLARP